MMVPTSILMMFPCKLGVLSTKCAQSVWFWSECRVNTERNQISHAKGTRERTIVRRVFRRGRQKCEISYRQTDLSSDSVPCIDGRVNIAVRRDHKELVESAEREESAFA